MVATAKKDIKIENTYSELDDSEMLNDQVIVNGKIWAQWREIAMKKDFKKSKNWQILKQNERELMNRLISAQD